MPRSTVKTGRFSEDRRAALGGTRGRQARAAGDGCERRRELRRRHRRQDRERRQGRAQVVCRQAQFAGVLRDTALVVRRVPDGVRPRRQLGEQENGNKKEMAQRIHERNLIDLDEQAFEVFALGKVQGHRVVGGASQAADDARLAPGIAGSAGEDLLEQLEADAAGARIGHQ